MRGGAFAIGTSCGSPSKLRLVVGTILNLINHFDLLLGTSVTDSALVQIGLTYIVPYCVSTHGQVFGGHRLTAVQTLT